METKKKTRQIKEREEIDNLTRDLLNRKRKHFSDHIKYDIILKICFILRSNRKTSDRAAGARYEYVRGSLAITDIRQKL